MASTHGGKYLFYNDVVVKSYKGKADMVCFDIDTAFDRCVFLSFLYIIDFESGHEV
jgi:hypothetical protein